MPTSAFLLPHSLHTKNRPELIAADDHHFALIATHLERELATLSSRLRELKRLPGGSGEAALERDTLIHRFSNRLSLLERFDLDMCLGRMVFAETGEIVYIGRMGLRDDRGGTLLVDWRTPAAKPFFAATLAAPLGLETRRRYRWADGKVTDFWDEAFASANIDDRAALDDQAAFITSLGTSRSGAMHDVLGTIQADQDAIIRADAHHPLVVDGGPGTGKTVVALHRAAYLLYSEPRVASGGGLLFVGPNSPYLAYVDDVLPRLGEEGVQLCTLADLVPEVAVGSETEQAAKLKGRLDPFALMDAAVSIYEEPPSQTIEVETNWGIVTVGRSDWARAFAAANSTSSHNESRDEVWEELLTDLVEDLIAEAERDIDNENDIAPDQVRAILARDEELREAFSRAWPILDPLDILGDVWAVPDYLRMVAPGLSQGEVELLVRTDPHAWTPADLPFIDAARRRIGDPKNQRAKNQASAEAAAEYARMSAVVDDLIATDDSELQEMSMLKGWDMRAALENPSGRGLPDHDRLAGPFGHIIVDEAQELTDAQWRMLLERCPSRSLTIVGDRAQARHGYTQSWVDRLADVGLTTTEVGLSINYRTPSEVMKAAEPVIRSVIPDANVPRSVRDSGIPVRYGVPSELDTVLMKWLGEHEEGVACVITVDPELLAESRSDNWLARWQRRVNCLAPDQVKGLEFDLVVLVGPEEFGGGHTGGDSGARVTGVVDQYVAMTRATSQLVVLRSLSS